MKKPSQSKAAQGKSKTQSQSHKELIAQIAAENKAYFAKLDTETPNKMPSDLSSPEAQAQKGVETDGFGLPWTPTQNLEIKKLATSRKETVQQITEDNRRYWASRKAGSTSKPKKQGISLPLPQIPEATWKMSCDRCRGQVEFPASIVGQRFPCPHCGIEITLHHSPPAPALGKEPSIFKQSPSHKVPPSHSVGTNNQPSFKLGFVGWCVIALILFFGAGFLLNTFFPMAVNDADAIAASKQLLQRNYPGVQSFDGNPVVTHQGNIYKVDLIASGLNSFGGPVRNEFLVCVKYDNEHWNLISVNQE
jgi:predicted RNA-binding Zn-ribbon protein involved in translation (DUF1610 family)